MTVRQEVAWGVILIAVAIAASAVGPGIMRRFAEEAPGQPPAVHKSPFLSPSTQPKSDASPDVGRIYDLAITYEHPRLLVSAHELPALRARALSGMREEFDFVRRWCDANMSTPFDQSRYDAAFVGRAMELYAFCHLVFGGSGAGEPSGDGATEHGNAGDGRYGRKALEIAQLAVTVEPLCNPSFGTARLSQGLSLVYDWCYHAARDEERLAIGRNLLRRVQFVVRSMNQEGFNPFLDYELLQPLLFAGAALAGDGINDKAASEAMELFIHKLTAGVIPARLVLGAKGSWPSRPDGALRTEAMLLAWAEVLRTAAGEDLYGELPFLRKAATAWLYWTRPDLTSAKAGVTEVRRPPVNPSHLYLMASRYGDRTGKYFADLLYDRMFSHGLERISDEVAAECLRLVMWKDDSLVPGDPSAALPHVRYFDDSGEVVMRSGWDFSPESRDVWTAVRCQKGMGPLGIAGQGHFTIVRGGDGLAIAAGYRGNAALPHFQKYAGTSRACNVIIVGERPQPPFDVFVPGEGLPEQFDRRGRIVRFHEGPGWVYLFMDLTNAYDRDDVYACHREIFQVGASLWVMLDRVVTSRSGTPLWWSLHSEGTPEILGPADIVEGNGTDGVLESRAARGVSFSAGGSELVVVPVLPVARIVRVAGGSAYAYYSGGRTYALETRLDEERLLRNEVGTWVMETEPIDIGRRVVFLNILAVGDVGAVAVPTCRAATRDGALVVELDLPAATATLRFRTLHEEAQCDFSARTAAAQ